MVLPTTNRPMRISVFGTRVPALGAGARSTTVAIHVSILHCSSVFFDSMPSAHDVESPTKRMNIKQIQISKVQKWQEIVKSCHLSCEIYLRMTWSWNRSFQFITLHTIPASHPSPSSSLFKFQILHFPFRSKAFNFQITASEFVFCLI